MFKDHFSGHASAYSEARPTYPESLFKFLNSLVPSHDLALDCATGNGQAALGLAPYFRKVIATDASAEQIANASPAGNVEYRVAPAEESGLPDATVDLVTVAQALHWFDHARFFEETRRVLKPGGIFATWFYRLLNLEERKDEVMPIIREFYQEVTGPYWPPERKHIDDGYAGIKIPFKTEKTPEFVIAPDWTLEQLLRYLETWSAVKYYIQAKQENPVQTWLKPRLLAVYKDLEAATGAKIPLTLLVGRH